MYIYMLIAILFNEKNKQAKLQTGKVYRPDRPYKSILNPTHKQK